MSLTLILTRHAKSDWGDPLQDDFDRPLNPRGRKSAPAIGAWLAAQGAAPDEVIVSGARRTVETWTLMARQFSPGSQMRSNPALYHAGAGTMLDVLRAQEAGTVMLIGHNPGIADFAERIVTVPPDHPRFHDYPTCATAVITFEADAWKDIQWGMGTATAFTVPRDLLEG